jgi:hypothetical protein
VATALAAKGRRDAKTALLAGVLTGVAGLCRTEWGIASLSACLLAIGVRRGWRGVVGPWASAVAGAVGVFGLVVFAFVQVAGFDAVVRDGHVLLTGLPEETRRFLRNASGVRDWSGGTLRMVHSAALWATAWLLLGLLASRGRDRAWRRRRWPLFAGAAAAGFLFSRYLAPFPMAAFSAAPLVGAFAAGIGLCRRGPAAASLAAFGSLALVLSYRKPFNISDWPYVAPPLLFAIVAAAGLLRLSQARAPAGVRSRLGRAGAAALAGLAITFFLFRAVTYARDPRIPVDGTSGLLRLEPGRAAWFASASGRIRDATDATESLVVFPEGELLNFLASRRNTLRHRLYIPGYLTDENEGTVLEQLRRARPGAIVVLDRKTGEYGRARFGIDYGRKIGRWIEAEYEPVALPDSGHADRLFLRKDGRAVNGIPVR